MEIRDAKPLKIEKLAHFAKRITSFECSSKRNRTEKKR